MYNVYSPTIQSMYGVPPGTMPTTLSADFMNPPAVYQQGDYNPLIQNANPAQYNYGPSQVPPMASYQQQRNVAAANLQQQLGSPLPIQVYGYGGMPQYNNGYGSYFQQQYQPAVQIVQGFNPLGVSEIPYTNHEQKAADIQNYYNDQAERYKDTRYNNYQNTYNYYGYYNTTYMDPNIIQGYNKAKSDLEQEAKDNRIEINKAISRMVHSYLGDGITEEQLDAIYDDKRITVPGMNYEDFQEQQEELKLSRLVDVHEMNVRKMREADAQVTQKHNQIVNKDSNLGEFMSQAGMLLYQDAYEAMQKAQKNRDIFTNKEFRDYIGSQIERREPNSNNANAFKALFETFPEAKDMISEGHPDGIDLMDDGSVKIQLPEYMRKDNELHMATPNKEQMDYAQERAKFISQIYNSGGGSFI